MSLTAISPIDGRYARVTKPLENYLSEFALMKYRVYVELEWLKFLCSANLENIRPLTDTEQQFLTAWQNTFTLEDASRIKEIERTTRHDVKAVEYAIRDKLKGSSLEDVGEFVHFACTSEDINNLSYALMLRDAYQHHLLPTMKKLLETITHLAQQNKSVAMMARTHGQPARRRWARSWRSLSTA
jgi:adenylosuccinate lyase